MADQSGEKPRSPHHGLACKQERSKAYMRVRVECYAGRIADERPVRFRLDEHEYLVEEVLDQWYGPEHVFFKLRADDRNVYILRRETSVPEGGWELVSFREHGERR